MTRATDPMLRIRIANLAYYAIHREEIEAAAKRRREQRERKEVRHDSAK